VDSPEPIPLHSLSPERQEEFVRLLNASHARLLRFIVSLVTRRHDAEDILQRVSITLWRRFGEFRPGSDFMAWATTVAAFEVKNFRRVSGRSRLEFDDELVEKLAAERSADLIFSDGRLDALTECIEKLDEPNRRLVDAVYARGEEIRDLAQREGKAPQTFYNRLNALRRLLTECVRQRIAQSLT
jgi:RNA polymerase sigma-70 factor (ECF subfamily)